MNHAGPADQTSDKQSNDVYTFNMNDVSVVLIDDRDMPGELRLDLDAFLRSQAEVDRLGAYIPRLEASAGALIMTTGGVLTTVYAFIPKTIKTSAGELVSKLVMKWAMKKFNLLEAETKECVVLFDQYDHPCVKVELDSVPRACFMNRFGLKLETSV